MKLKDSKHIKPMLQDYPESQIEKMEVERTRLTYVLNKISKKIAHLKQYMPYPGVSLYETGWDAEDRALLMEQKIANADTYTEIKELSKFNDSPYFARMDFILEPGNDVSLMYIGKKSLKIDEEFLVYDWRSPLGQRYYLKSETKFSYNKYDYKLFLRRAIDIKNGELDEIFDEYFDDTAFDISPEKNSFKESPNKKAFYKQEDEIRNQEIGSIARTITDPFLIKILKEKRNDNNLTDIIRSIQENQNNIIRYAFDKNIVVQGCAGSGKTMILLHRLSYLKFNNNSLDVSKIKILTPNELFDIHINNLTISLELDKISRLTIEAYYCELLNRYNKDWVNGRVNIFPEEEMSQNYINFIYSLDFAKQLLQEYNLWIEKTKDCCDSLLSDVMKKYAILYSISEAKGDKLFSRVDFFIRQIKSEAQKIETRYLDIERKYDSKAKELKLHDEEDNNEQINATAIIKAFTEQINIKIEVYIHEKTVLLNGLQQIIEEKNQQLTIACEKMKIEKQSKFFQRIFTRSSKNTTIKQFESQIDVLAKEQKSCLNILNDAKSFDLLSDNVTYEQINEVIQQFLRDDQALQDGLPKIELLFERANSNIKRKTILSELEIIRKDLAYLNSRRLSELEKNNVENATQIIADFMDSKKRSAKLKEIFQSLLAKTSDNILDLSSIKNRNRITRATLYAQLMFCYLHFGPLTKTDHMLCIDEGQDISFYEYEMLKKVNGSIVFNIFGDSNQLIKVGRGTENWNQVVKYQKAEYFTLDENYRNSKEINDYCNKVFSFNTKSIGVSCGNVEFVDLQFLPQAINNLILLQKRSAIIISAKYRNDERLKQLITMNPNIIPNEIIQGKIALLTVEQAKGLEFDETIVIPTGMSKNELYISFTRALSKLSILNEPNFIRS